MALSAPATKSDRSAALANGADTLAASALLATLICAAPSVAVLLLALGAKADDISSLFRDGVLGTTALTLVGGAGATMFGVLAAWLVSACAFPLQRQFEWLLALPLAAPSYVLAYAYTGMTWAGAAPIEVRGFWGAAFIYAVGLYPYVYLSARAAFASGSASALEAARSLGAKPREVFFRIALPLARPGIAAGGALAAMEIAADYGAAQHFGLTTLSTAVFRVWQSHQDLAGALHISAALLLAALIFLTLERRARGRATFTAGVSRTQARYRLRPVHAGLAFAFCAVLVLLGAGLPLAWLARLALLHADPGDFAAPLFNSVLLASLGAMTALALSLIIAAAARRTGLLGKAALTAASIGYAAPGAVIAIGALSVFAFARESGWIGGLGAGLALCALLWTYAARFTAAGVQPIDAGLARLSKGIDSSARVLGASGWRRLVRIDLPIAAPSLAAAALILFVEILKELPATLILRPFNFDTLAVRAHAYASDERLLQAAAPSLLIFAAGLIPLVVLSRNIGARSDAR